MTHWTKEFAIVKCKTKSKKPNPTNITNLFNCSPEGWEFYIYRMAMALPPAKQPGSTHELQMDYLNRN